MLGFCIHQLYKKDKLNLGLFQAPIMKINLQPENSEDKNKDQKKDLKKKIFKCGINVNYEIQIKPATYY